MKISCVLTSYNRPRMVKQAIESVMAQTYQDWELLVADDGSDVETLTTLLNIVRDQPYKKVQLMLLTRLEHDKCRYAVTINRALNEIDGDLVTYLTDDDYFLPQRFERMVEKFQDPNVFVVYGDQSVEWLDNNWGVSRSSRRGTVGVTRNPQCRIDHNSFMHRRECLDRIEKPYWPENDWRNGDIGFFNRLVEHWDFHPIDEVLDVHRWHHNNIQSRMIRGESPIYKEEL